MPTVTLADIDIWLSGLKHRDKFKAAVKNMNYLSNPTLFAIPHELWATYHNFNAYIWYNEIFYEWEYRCIPSLYSDSCLHYQLLERLSTGITNLNPVLIHSHKLAVTFQKIAWDENSSIPYFKQKIIYSDKEYHTTRDETTFPEPQPR